MDLTDIQTIKSLLGQYGLRPRKYLGQHFLVDREVLRKIVGAAEISKTDTVLEIGPGLGALTLELAKRAKKIIAVEKDKELAGILQYILKQEKIKNVEIVVGDILEIKNFKFQASSFKIAANLPYYLTARIIRKFMETDNPPSEMVLMVQKEVAERVCASPPRMSLLAVSVQFYAKPEIIAFVSKKSFWPEPEVDSAIIKIIYHDKQIDTIWDSDGRVRISRDRRPSERYSDAFFKIVRAGFSSPRKKLAGNLAKDLPKLTRQKAEDLLRKTGLRPDCRSQDLSVDNWRGLVSLFFKKIV